MKERILVAGATGYVGKRLVFRLLEKGYFVRCLARSPEKLTGQGWENVEIYKGDVLNPDSMIEAFSGIDIVYYLIHSMDKKGDFAKRELLSAQNFAQAAKDAGVKRIIYLGALAKDDQNLSKHLKSRQRVGKIMSDYGINVTELRASIIIGSGSASFEIIRDLVKKLPIMITPRWVKSKCQPIAIRDVLNYLVEILEHPETSGKVFEIGGSEIMTYAEMMKKFAQAMNKKLLIIGVPVLTPRLSAYWLNIMTTVPMSLAYPLIDGLRNDSICSSNDIDNYIKFEKMTFIDAVQSALNKDKIGKITSRWTEATVELKEELNPDDTRILDYNVVIQSNLDRKQLFERIERIGGINGWYYADWLWKLRGILDRMVGGIGTRIGRMDPNELRVGDAVDFWRVEKYIPGELVRFRAEMKLPGDAWLEFSVGIDNNANTTLKQRAIFLPKGIIGRIYWYSLYFIHIIIFTNMAKRIALEK